jgi:hypothetical protein
MGSVELSEKEVTGNDGQNISYSGSTPDSNGFVNGPDDILDHRIDR